MKVYDIMQGDIDWIKVRLGKVSASEADALLTPKFAAKTGAGVHTYLCKKVAETFRGQPLMQFSSFASEQGQILEEEARAWVALTSEEKISNVGFIESDDGRCGCSPDGLLDDDGGLEIKSPQPVNHVRYLLDGILPDDYAVQVHFNLYVSGRKYWKFVSYHRGYPAFVLRVERDDEICKKIESALTSFYVKLDAALTTIKSIKN